MSAVVADTHVAVWMLTAPERLSAVALAALQRANADGDLIHLASVSIVEVVYLIEKGRLPRSVLDRLIKELTLADAGMVLVSLDLPVAETLRQIPRATVPDMPDRIIAATALYLGLPLVTRDRAIQASALTTIW